jgi:GNAT superfamily N-acetyltransferase
VHWPGRLAELIEDWVYLIQRDGWRYALPEVGRAIVTLPYRHIEFIVLARSLLEPLPDLQSRIALEIREFGSADLNLARQINRPSEARVFAQRLAHGHVGFLAQHEGQPAGYAWACTEIDPTIERVNLKLDPGDVLCTDAYTASAYRGQGVQTALTLACLRLFRDLGYRRALAIVEVRNHPSLAVWRRKVGAQAIGWMTFFRIGSWRRVRYRVVGIE